MEAETFRVNGLFVAHKDHFKIVPQQVFILVLVKGIKGANYNFSIL